MKNFRKILTERNAVVILFIMVVTTFSFAQRDSKKIEKLYIGFSSQVNPSLTARTPIKTLDNLPGNVPLKPQR